MENQVQEKIIEPTTGLANNFVKLEKDKRSFLKFTNWRTVEVMRTVEENGIKKTIPVPEWRADVTQFGEKKDILSVLLPPKLLSLSNKKFRKKINDIVADRQPTETVFISIKRMNEGKETDYDVELQ